MANSPGKKAVGLVQVKGVNMEYHAELKAVSEVTIGRSTTGYIFEDTHTHGNHPFPNGSYIFTSTIQDITQVEGVTYIITRNTVYKLI